jgi:diguanylate cyclase (GGDEF)-like protein
LPVTAQSIAAAPDARAGAAVDTADDERALLRERLDNLYGGWLAGLLFSAAVASGLVVVHAREGYNSTDGIWLGLLIGAWIGRAILAQRYQRSERDPASLPRHLALYRAATLTTAALWGVAGLLFSPDTQPVLQGFTTLVLAGVSIGAVSSNITDTFTHRLFVLLSLSPISLKLMLTGSQLPVTLGLLLVFLGVFLVISGRRTYQTMTEAIRLRSRNAALMSDLAREKTRQVAHTETMMRTVLRCAPIALWAIDREGNLTFMDGNRIGNDNGLALPKVGDNLLTAFEDQPQIVYETRRALAGERFTTEIELEGHVYEVHYSPHESGGDHGAIGVAIDVSERKRHERELDQRAHYDHLTGLPNRTLLLRQIAHAFDQAKRQHQHIALLFLDLDNFKGVNDTMGHSVGDELLRMAADRLRQVVRNSDVAGRLGGDEFLVVGECLSRPDDAEIIAHKLTRAFQRPFLVQGRELFVTISVGIAIYPDDGEEPEQLLQCADTAMYQAKSQGKNMYRFFTAEMQRRAERHLIIEFELRRAVQRNELRLVYQPKFGISSHRVQGVEALLRWESPSLGPVAPDEFVAVAEFAGLMSTIGEWVMQTACTAASRWQTIAGEPIPVSVNVSPQQFRHPDLLANVAEALSDTGLEPDLLELEITEGVLMQDAPETHKVLAHLRDLRVRLSLDDFGTGYSSLGYLKSFPLQVLKIDKSFIQDLGRDRNDEVLVDAIIAMAKSLGLQVVAEGVETPQQLAFLAARDVELAQGFLFSRPIAEDALVALLSRQAAGDIAMLEIAAS